MDNERKYTPKELELFAQRVRQEQEALLGRLGDITSELYAHDRKELREICEYITDELKDFSVFVDNIYRRKGEGEALSRRDGEAILSRFKGVEEYFTNYVQAIRRANYIKS